VNEILAGMEEGCRNLILAYFIEERSYGEIAAHLHVPVGTVKSRLFRCMAAFRRTLAHRRRPVARPGIDIRDRFGEPNPDGG
jgi:DNA-directed RNA polymerase specialized sigma24 family protein